MYTITPTFQQTFVDQIANLVHHAYNCGLLQYHPMLITDVTITMTMFKNFNQLAVQYNNKLLSISMYDEDSQDAQYASIKALITDIVA
jgi:hypothetical protein